ncbi:MAG TPA: SsrA-binding protein SmpB [Burkholderiales bacterium]|nr:SsrA-binding protein SmpB [Burkholderiales bacterium]
MNISNNKKALHDYFIEDKYEAGIILEGWEIKAIREGKVQLRDSYVKIKNGEIWLLGCHISPLISASSHVHPDADRIRKLLLNKAEINKLIGKVEQKGYSIIALNLHFKKGRVKVEIALAKGKKLYDKRKVEKEKELNREKMAVIKQYKRL